jgi:CTP:molybdopterin cytidylyltransferase MocA
VSVAAALLAAGLGTRYAGPTAKPLALLRGRPLVAWALDAMVESGLHPTVVVVGDHTADAVAALAPATAAVVLAPDARLGIAHSLHAALDALEPELDVSAVCIGLADQPGVGAEAYRRLARVHEETGTDFAVATYAGERRNPVLLGRSQWPAARALEGDTGARLLMGEQVVTVDCTGTGDPRDVDTLDDLHALEQEMDR